MVFVLGIKAKDEKPVMNGTMEQREKKPSSLLTDKLRTSQTKETNTEKTKDTIQRQEDSSNTANNRLSVDNKSDVRRAHSWGKRDERPELNKRVSSSLDDLTKGIEEEEKAEDVKLRSRVQALKNKRPVSLNLESPREEGGNKLVDILDSIKKASDGKQNMAKSSSNASITSLNDVDVNVNHKDSLLSPNKSNLQTKSYSYSCLADLKLGEDGKFLLF